MELKVSKHSNDEEMSLSTDVYRFLQQDHNVLSQFDRKYFYCEVCAKGFLEENELHYHKLDHIIDKPLFICDDSIEEPISEKHTLPEDKKMCQTYEKTFTCERCEKHFSTISCLRIHQRFFHFEYIPTSACDRCGSHFKWKHHLAVHKYVDSSEKASLCDTCNINSRKESYASDKGDDESSVEKNHQNIQESSYTHQPSDVPINKKHICHLCQREFSFKGNLCRHMLLIHTRKKLFSRKYCEKKYLKKANLITNAEIQTKKTPFICNICKKNFTHEGFLNRHLRLHSERRLFCIVCHKAFFNNIIFKKHLSTHSTEKLFVCRLCLKCFVHQNDLDCHLQKHSDEKPYPCDFCERRFIRKGCLATHIMRFHSNQRPA